MAISRHPTSLHALQTARRPPFLLLQVKKGWGHLQFSFGKGWKQGGNISSLRGGFACTLRLHKSPVPHTWSQVLAQVNASFLPKHPFLGFLWVRGCWGLLSTPGALQNSLTYFQGLLLLSDMQTPHYGARPWLGSPPYLPPRDVPRLGARCLPPPSPKYSQHIAAKRRIY